MLRGGLFFLGPQVASDALNWSILCQFSMLRLRRELNLKICRYLMLTSAKLPSIAFLRNVSLGLSFADAVAIENANTIAVPSDKTILFTASSY